MGLWVDAGSEWPMPVGDVVALMSRARHPSCDAQVARSLVSEQPDAVLSVVWRHSGRSLERGAGGVTAQLVQLRGALLDELEERDSVAFEGWLGSGGATTRSLLGYRARRLRRMLSGAGRG